MRFEWDQLIRYGPDLLQAFGVTIWISAVSLVIGIVIGMFACLGKLQQRGLAFRLSNGFIDFFRTIPEVVLIFWVYSMMIFARLLGSWFPNFSRSRVMRFLAHYTDPYLNLFRRIIPPLGMIDLSPIVAFLALWLLESLVLSIF